MPVHTVLPRREMQPGSRDGQLLSYSFMIKLLAIIVLLSFYNITTKFYNERKFVEATYTT